jgi:hypothetical protein
MIRPVAEARVVSYLVLGLMGAGDLVAGIVISAVGMAQDIQVALVVGTVLLLAGAGMLGWVVWAKCRPTAL